jgi:hypothetical protein
MSYPKEKRRFDHGGFVIFATPAMVAALAPAAVRQRVKWRCPNCGGDCFGTSLETRHCHGHSFGTSTEQSQGCGYWEDDLGNRGVQ